MWGPFSLTRKLRPPTPVSAESMWLEAPAALGAWGAPEDLGDVCGKKPKTAQSF